MQQQNITMHSDPQQHNITVALEERQIQKELGRNTKELISHADEEKHIWQVHFGIHGASHIHDIDL